MTIGAATLLLVSVLVPSARAVSPNGVVVAEIQTAGSDDAGAEFVRLSNQGVVAVVVDGWKLQYKSASGSSWVTKAVLSGELAVGGDLILATDALATTESHQVMSSGLAQSGGHVQVLDAGTLVQDVVGWGTAIAAETAPAPAPIGGQSLLRRRVGETYQDSDNNLADFELEVMPLPPPVPPPTPKPASPSSQAITNTPPASNSGLLAPTITEILPNPAAPQTDAHDEFVEVYNPNSKPFILAGYRLQTGVTYSNSVNLKELTIPANSFLVITSADSSLSLSNSGGGVRLLDPDGSVVAEAAAYDKAAAGQSWATVDGNWQWSSQPTPGGANVATSTETGNISDGSGSGAVQGSSQTKASAKNSTKDKSATDQQATKSPRIHTVIIALVASLAVGYAIYEYRHDIGNYIYKLRTYRARRRSLRQTPEGR